MYERMNDWEVVKTRGDNNVSKIVERFIPENLV